MVFSNIVLSPKVTINSFAVVPTKQENSMTFLFVESVTYLKERDALIFTLKEINGTNVKSLKDFNSKLDKDIAIVSYKQGIVEFHQDIYKKAPPEVTPVLHAKTKYGFTVIQPHSKLPLAFSAHPHFMSAEKYKDMINEMQKRNVIAVFADRIQSELKMQAAPRIVERK